MFRKIGSTLAAGAIALSGLVALSTPALADATVIQCPQGSTASSYDNAKKRGVKVDEYFLLNTAVVIYRVDNRHEAYVTNGWNVTHACFNKKPDRPEGARDTEKPQKATGGGGAGVHAPSYGGWGMNLHPVPTPNKGKVTVGPVESVS